MRFLFVNHLAFVIEILLTGGSVELDSSPISKKCYLWLNCQQCYNQRAIGLGLVFDLQLISKVQAW